MGTNFYTKIDPCPHCGRTDNKVHIGKSSHGWEFLFAPNAEFSIHSAKEWWEFLKDRVIVDEYGDTVNLDYLKNMVESKRGGWTAQTAPDYAWGTSDRNGWETEDEDGYRFSRHEEFF